MTDKDKRISIGVIWQAGGHWHAGALYRENLIKVLLPFAKRKEIKLSIVVETSADIPHGLDPSVKVLVAPDYSLCPGVGRVEAKARRDELVKRSKSPLKWLQRRLSAIWYRRVLKRDFKATLPPVVNDEDSLFGLCRDESVDFLYPLPKLQRNDINGAHWIPDLQHCFLPELFSEDELKQRNDQFDTLSKSKRVVFSSLSSLEDFRQHWPDANARLDVWHFCSIMDESLMEVHPETVAGKYQLPDEFFVVPNQFWKHKDHFCVIEALKALSSRGVHPVVVFTGAIDDYRNRDHINHFLQSVQEMGLHAQVRLLGFMDRSEQIALVRGAAAVIQPSRFEGWSTVVEDCRAIGQRLILSDLKVHQEQAPDHSLFFETGSAESLAESIAAMLPTNADWVSSRSEREGKATTAMEDVRRRTGEQFIEKAKTPENSSSSDE